MLLLLLLACGGGRRGGRLCHVDDSGAGVNVLGEVHVDLHSPSSPYTVSGVVSGSVIKLDHFCHPTLVHLKGR